MQDRRNRLRQHIRAARAWLGQAEKSLEHENDVQGDLKLMLARAELKRAEDSGLQGPARRFVSRVLPLTAAAVLFGAGWYIDGGSEPAGQMEISVPAGSVREQSSSEALPDRTEGEQSEAVKVSPELQEMEVSRGPDSGTEAAASFVPAEGAVREPAPPEIPAEMPVSDDLPKHEALPDVPQGLPSTDMQQLMQSAGQILRAQE